MEVPRRGAGEDDVAPAVVALRVEVAEQGSGETEWSGLGPDMRAGQIGSGTGAGASLTWS